MHILHLIPSLAKGGAERLALNSCLELQKREGVKVKLITFRAENSYAFLSKEIDHSIIPASVIPSILGKWTRDISELQRVVDAFQPDVIHTHLFEAEMVVSQLQLPPTRRIVHFHDNMPQLSRLRLKYLFNKKAVTAYFERMIVLRSYLKHTTTFIAISKNTEYFIRKNLGKRKPVKLLLNAIQTERFFAEPELARQPYIVNIGSLVPKKNQQFALKVMRTIKAKGIELHLDILGDGPDRKMLEHQIQEMALEDTITLHGNVDHPEEFLKKASFYLHTATYEPFGLVLLEAMAAGAPVISLDGGGNKDVIHHKQNGFLLTDQDPEQFAALIISLLNDETQRLQIGKAGQAFALGFGIKAYVDRLLEIYKS